MAVRPRASTAPAHFASPHGVHAGAQGDVGHQPVPAGTAVVAGTHAHGPMYPCASTHAAAACPPPFSVVHWDGCDVAAERAGVDHGASNHPSEGVGDHGIYRPAGHGRQV
eukprot:361539-Chlamydomonas_euryale.AAC.2